MCDDDTTNGEEKTPSGDLQLFMQYFNRSSLVTCGCWYDDVMVPGLLGGWGGGPENPWAFVPVPEPAFEMQGGRWRPV